MLTLIGSGFALVSQIGIALAEMALWMYPWVHSRLTFVDEKTQEVKPFTAEIARIAGPIVMNAGLYNAFLAAGLIWGLVKLNRKEPRDVLAFFLACVAIAGVFGAITLRTTSPFPTTLLIQTLPAVLGLAGLWKRSS